LLEHNTQPRTHTIIQGKLIKRVHKMRELES